MADDPTKTDPAHDPEVDETDEPEGDEPEGDGDEEEWTPPTREQWQAQQDAHKAALEAERAKLARARKQAERLRKGGTGKPESTAAGEEGAQPAASGEVDVWRGRAVRAAAKAELLDRGADPEMVDLALGRLKVGEIEFSDEDEPELDDWLDEMQERYPKLFAKTPSAPAEPTRPRAGRVDQGAPSGAGRPVRPKLGLGQQIIANSQAAARRGVR